MNLSTDPWVRRTLDDVTRKGSSVFSDRATTQTTLGEPVFVRALAPGAKSEWLVPVRSVSETVGIIGAKVDQDGRGAAGFYGGWSGTFPHALSVAEATTKGSAPGDPVVTVELVWATISPLEGGPGTAEYPFYRLVRQGGSEWFLFQNGNLVSAANVHPLD